MNGGPDFELYTISLIRLNTAFEKLEADEKEALKMIKKKAVTILKSSTRTS